MVPRRRVSVDFYTGQAVTSIQRTVGTLHQIWDEVSLGDHERIDRVDGFYKTLKELMDNVIGSEKEMVRSIHSNIDQWLGAVRDMRRELDMPAFDSSGFRHGSVALFKALEKEKDRLQSMKDNRVSGQTQVLSELTSAAMRIGEEIERLQDVDEVGLWNHEEMNFWQLQLDRVNAILNERLDQARQWKADLKRWFGQTERTPVTELESTFYELDLDDPDLVIDAAFMEEFLEAHQMAKEGFNEWIDLADFEYSEAIVRLKELWELCHVPEGDRQFAPHFNPDVHSASDIRNVKAEVEKLVQLHEERLAVYDKLKEWKELWAEKVDFEKNASDKSYYWNRGGRLNVLLQRQRYIESRLPVVGLELGSANDAYRNEHPDAPILLEGLEPNEYIEWIIREYKEQKVIGRSRRKNGIITRSMDSRMTPKKRVAGSAFSTPCSAAKIPRTQRSTKTPSKKVTFTQDLRSRDESIEENLSSPEAFITPVRSPVAGPKTSSFAEDLEGCVGTRRFLPHSARRNGHGKPSDE